MAAEVMADEAMAAERGTVEAVTPAAPMTAETVTIEALTPEPTPTPEPTATGTMTFEMPTPEPTNTGTLTLEAIGSEALTPRRAASAAVIPEPLTGGPVTARAVTPVPARPAAALAQVASNDAWATPAEEEDEEEPTRPAALGAIIGLLVIIGVIWAGVRMLGGQGAPAPPVPVAVQPPSAPVAAGAAAPAPVSAGSISREAASEATRLHQVIPDVPAGARRSIRGHIKVWVRVIVNRDGSVFAATPDRTGSSRYFERLALEAAKKWTFPPADAPSQRLVQIHFDFSREGVTARFVTLR
jgi:TonB family protein